MQRQSSQKPTALLFADFRSAEQFVTQKKHVNKISACDIVQSAPSVILNQPRDLRFMLIEGVSLLIEFVLDGYGAIEISGRRQAGFVPDRIFQDDPGLPCMAGINSDPRPMIPVPDRVFPCDSRHGSRHRCFTDDPVCDKVIG